MSSQEPVNRYKGPRAEHIASASRLPEIEKRAARGWQDHMIEARSLARTARTKIDPKERMYFALSSVAQYSSAIEKMSDYNASRSDPSVAREIRQATAEMDGLKMQMHLDSD